MSCISATAGKWAEEYPGRLIDEKNLMGGTREDPNTLDDWARCGIETAEDIKDLFVHEFLFWL